VKRFVELGDVPLHLTADVLDMQSSQLFSPRLEE
jgi:hypothetical protein